MRKRKIDFQETTTDMWLRKRKDAEIAAKKKKATEDGFIKSWDDSMNATLSAIDEAAKIMRENIIDPRNGDTETRISDI